MKEHFVDANVIVRFLTKDNLTQALAVQKLLENSKDKIILSDVIFAEVVWLLTSYYKISKQIVIKLLKDLLDLPTIQSNYFLLIKALYFYENKNIDYIDGYLAALSEEGSKTVYSFDRDFDKIKTIKRIEP